MKKQRQFLSLSILVACLAIGSSARAEEGEVFYRFPEIHNPNPVAGRLFLQPIGDHDDQVIEGLRIDAWGNSYSEYNRRFHDGSYGKGWEAHPNETGVPVPNLLYMNGNTIQLTIAKGFRVKGLKIEGGAIVRSYVDRGKDSEMEVFLAWFHKVEGNSPQYIPLPNQGISGVVGDQKTVVIGEAGQVYMTSADLYAKVQLLEEKQYLPNVSVKLVTRLPLSSRPFDTFGVGSSIGVSKGIFDWLTLIGAASMAYQNIDQGDFQAHNLRIYPWSSSLFGGFVVDPGKKGGFYLTAGFRFSTVRLSYSTNPSAVAAAKVMHASLNYRDADGRYEAYIFANEEVPHFDQNLEPDFLFGVGFSYYGKNDKIPVRHE